MSSRRGLLIVDVACPRPYSACSLETAALGGTEATVVRIARALAATRPVWVAQRFRERPLVDAGVRWIPYTHEDAGEIAEGLDDIIVVRCHKVLRRLRKRHPHARLFLWMHCFPGRRLHDFGRAALATDTTVVAVSDHHRVAMRAFLVRHDPLVADRVRMVAIYNPVEAALGVDDTRVDRDKLVFLSSPHKGIERVLETFAFARRVVPTLRLFVANPGYLDRHVALPDGVVPLGKLPHHDAIRHTREALCLFYPQAQFAETFGLVFAEANAVGTPVIAHPLGAAQEVLAQEASQLLDANAPDAIVQRLVEWRAGARPRVGPDPRFRLENVLGLWDAAFDASPTIVGRRAPG